MPSKTKHLPLLLETIKIEDGTIANIYYHQQRCNLSRKALYDSNDILDLTSAIKAPQSGVFRCRIVYAKQIHSIEYIPYQAKTIHTLRIVPTHITYPHKYADRKALETLTQTHQDVDDILIEKEGYIRDTSIANIAFYDGTTWLTPHNTLLNGTMRQKLLDEGFLEKKQIKTEDLKRYTHVALMNAMLGFKILKNVTIYDNTGKHYDY